MVLLLSLDLVSRFPSVIVTTAMSNSAADGIERKPGTLSKTSVSGIFLFSSVDIVFADLVLSLLLAVLACETFQSSSHFCRIKNSLTCVIFPFFN